MSSNTDHQIITAAVRAGLRAVIAAGITDAEQNRRRSALIRRLLATSGHTRVVEEALAGDILARAHVMTVPPPWAGLDDDLVAFHEAAALDVLLDNPPTAAAYAHQLYGYLAENDQQFPVDTNVVMICGLVELALTLRALSDLD